MKKIKVGMIGVGSISEMHIKSYLNNQDVELIGFCDINEERLQEKQKRYGVKYALKDYKEFLKIPEMDAVSICTWNNFHSPIAIEALKSGKKVLCEKPLCMTVAEALEIEKTVKETGGYLQVGFVRRYAENTNLVKAFIDSGELGDIYYAKLSALRRIGNPGGWFADVERSGGGPMIDIGVHLIDMAWYLMGKPEVQSVSGNVYVKLGNMGHIVDKKTYKAADYSAEQNSVEDSANALIRFKNGASLFIDASYSLHVEKDCTSAELFGTKGGARVEPSARVYTERYNRLMDIVPNVDNPTFNFDNSFQREINAFVDSCMGKSQNISPVGDGLMLMKILNSIYQSSKTGKEILF